MNVLITGATGFIGRHLTAALSKAYSVRCLVRRTSDTKELSDLNVDLAYGDLLDKDSLGPALVGIDLVYHLAGEVYSRKKEDYYKGNVLATQNLLEACKKKGTKRIIFLSSTAVYKFPNTKTLLTEESEYEPLSIYGKTKLAAEELIKKCNIPWIIVRATVVYGPRQSGIVNKLFIDLVIKKRMFVIGDGNNLRSLCFIQNLVDGLLLLADKQDISEETFIFSDNSSLTLNEIIETASSITKQRIRITRLPDILGDISGKAYSLMGRLIKLYFVELYSIKLMQTDIGYDITKAKTELGYNPIVTLDAGMTSTAEWLKKRVEMETAIS
jgi:nucleoside-diphosphate-sugar epimerase